MRGLTIDHAWVDHSGGGSGPTWLGSAPRASSSSMASACALPAAAKRGKCDLRVMPLGSAP
eukprot:176701-Pyramimonas_sp.AAC.1